MITYPKYSKGVTKILKKGSDITTSEMDYLIKKNISVKDISAHTGLKKTEILECKRNLEALVPKKKRREYRSLEAEVTPSVDTYIKLKKKYADIHIAKKFGMSNPTLRAWKVSNGIQKPNVKELTLDKYKQHKLEKLTDLQIMKLYEIPAYMLIGWRNLNAKELGI